MGAKFAELTFCQGTSNKFWRVEIDASDVTVCFGRIGTAGRMQTKRYGDHRSATRAAEKQVNAKLRKGYLVAATSSKTWKGGAATRAPSADREAATPEAAQRRALLVRASKLRRGIDRDAAHPRARELATEAFFWDCADELAPFGSDEGATSLDEYLDWRRRNPKRPLKVCLEWAIEGVGEIPAAHYDERILEREQLERQLQDPTFDDQQYVYTLDVTVYATALSQLVLEGRIDEEAKPLCRLALGRQELFAELCAPTWQHAARYASNLAALRRIVKAA